MAITITIKLPELHTTEGICRSIVHSKESLWLSCRRHGITLVLKALRKYIDTMQRDVLLQLLQKVDIPNIKVKSG